MLEIATNGLLSMDRTGALKRVAPDGSQETVVSKGLEAPTGLAISRHGKIYISNNGDLAGEGEVVRVKRAGSSQQAEPAGLRTGGLLRCKGGALPTELWPRGKWYAPLYCTANASSSSRGACFDGSREFSSTTPSVRPPRLTTPTKQRPASLLKPVFSPMVPR